MKRIIAILLSTAFGVLVGFLVCAVIGESRLPSLHVRKPCAIVGDTEDPSGKFVEYTVRCLEYTGKIQH